MTDSNNEARYILRLRIHNELGEGFTDIATDRLTAERLMDAGCTHFFGYSSYNREPTHVYVEIYTEGYVLASQIKGQS